jgi:hypothetical protein
MLQDETLSTTELQSGQTPAFGELPWSVVVSRGSAAAGHRQTTFAVHLEFDGQD